MCVCFAPFLFVSLLFVVNCLKQPPEATELKGENIQQERFFKLHFDFYGVLVENCRLFFIEIQVHTNSHITLWLPEINKTICCSFRIMRGPEMKGTLGALARKLKILYALRAYSNIQLKGQRHKM